MKTAHNIQGAARKAAYPLAAAVKRTATVFFATAVAACGQVAPRSSVYLQCTENNGSAVKQFILRSDELLALRADGQPTSVCGPSGFDWTGGTAPDIALEQVCEIGPDFVFAGVRPADRATRTTHAYGVHDNMLCESAVGLIEATFAINRMSGTMTTSTSFCLPGAEYKYTGGPKLVEWTCSKIDQRKF